MFHSGPRHAERTPLAHLSRLRDGATGSPSLFRDEQRRHALEAAALGRGEVRRSPRDLRQAAPRCLGRAPDERQCLRSAGAPAAGRALPPCWRWSIRLEGRRPRRRGLHAVVAPAAAALGARCLAAVVRRSGPRSATASAARSTSRTTAARAWRRAGEDRCRRCRARREWRRHLLRAGVPRRGRVPAAVVAAAQPRRRRQRGGDLLSGPRRDDGEGSGGGPAQRRTRSSLSPWPWRCGRAPGRPAARGREGGVRRAATLFTGPTCRPTLSGPPSRGTGAATRGTDRGHGRRRRYHRAFNRRESVQAAAVNLSLQHDGGVQLGSSGADGRGWGEVPRDGKHKNGKRDPRVSYFPPRRCCCCCCRC